jgi:lipopolysaccharide assembly protein A
MGAFFLILALLFSLLIAIVALANNDPVSVSYLFGRSHIPLILLILGSAISGAAAMGLFSIFRGIRTALKQREERRRFGELSARVETLEKEKAVLEAELRRFEVQDQKEQPGAEAGAERPAGEQPEQGPV